MNGHKGPFRKILTLRLDLACPTTVKKVLHAHLKHLRSQFSSLVLLHKHRLEPSARIKKHRITRGRSWTGCNAIHDAPSDEFILKLTRHFFSRLIGLSMPRLLPAVAVQIITNKIFFFAIFFFSAVLFPWGKKRGGQFQDKLIRGRVVYSVTTSRASSPAYSMV